MKLLFDQNISHRIVQSISGKYPASTSVKGEGLINSTDLEIWEFAKANNFTIVTQDSDFNDLNSLLGFPPKIIWIRTGNLKTQGLATILTEYYDEISNFITNQNFGCFEVFHLRPR